MITREQLEGPQKITWCTGCGNFGILAALKKAVQELGISQNDFVLISGIGCSGKLPHYVNLNAMHTLHGRAMAVAQGVHLANLDLHVVVHVGDGDTLGEGLGHFMHAARRNADLAVFIHNNGVMGLTKGQYSPSSPRGYISRTSPPEAGVPMNPVNIVALALTAGATFVARGFSGDQKMLVALMRKAVKHKGFALVDILQPCVTWNKQLTWKFYNEHTFSLQDKGHNISNRMAALEKAFNNSEEIPIGVFYEEKAPTLAESLALPQDGRLRDHKTDMNEVQSIIDEFVI
ncbi:MAG: 2-oxoacid:ferredoxin oxidoreductase subunit beta [Candidatus Thorarchaeota archaeon]